MRLYLALGVVALAWSGCGAQCRSWEAPVYPGTNEAVNALCVYDADGAGPMAAEVVVGGAFTAVGAQYFGRIASWNGAAGVWSGVLVGVATVDRMYAFERASGGEVLNIIAGRTVRQLTEGVSVQRPSVDSGTILAVAGLPNPFGEEDLVIGGTFAGAGGVAVSRLAVWQEYRWWPLGGAPNGAVHALMAVPDGSGVALIAAGEFTQIGDVAANRIAKWDGVRWSALGTGIGGAGAIVKCLAWGVGAGGGVEVYAGGSFTQAGGAAAASVARWDGAAWTPGPGGLTVGAAGAAVINSITSDPQSGLVYAGGTFNRVGGVSANVAVWRGGAWQAVGGPLTGEVRTMGFEPTTGALIVGGTIAGAGRGVVRLVEGNWAALADGFDEQPRSLTVRTGADGREELFAGGKFTHVDRATARGVVRRVDGRWEEVGGGVPSARPVTLMTGPDERVYALGWFATAGGVAARDVAVWDGVSWSQVGSGLARYRFFSEPRAMTIAANGDLVIAGGGAASATDGTRRGVLRWTGSEWVSLGESPDGTTEYRAIVTLEGGDLVLGGAFSAVGGVACANLATWDGSAWHAFGPGANGRVNCVLARPGGGFVVGGRFTSIGGIAARGAAMWDGVAWHAMDLPAEVIDAEVQSLAWWDADGEGPGAEGVVCGNGPRRWDGQRWVVVPGVSPQVPAEGMVGGGDGALAIAGTFLGGVAGVGLLVPPTITVLSQPWPTAVCGGNGAFLVVTARVNDESGLEFRWQMEWPPYSDQWTEEIPNSSASECVLELSGGPNRVETRYRCVMTACGVTVTTEPAVVGLCYGDMDCDQDTDADDVILFFGEWDTASFRADLNQDGGTDSDDVIWFFESWDSGC